MLNYRRYRRNPVVDYPEREWVNRQIEKAPVWCSVDLRDGNQALIDPMIVSEKIEFFNYLIKLGFKEIEIGFPAASRIEYDFLRQLVDRKMIPDDVVVQVLKTGDVFRIAIEAPKSMDIRRAKVQEAMGEVPECIRRVRAQNGPKEPNYRRTQVLR